MHCRHFQLHVLSSRYTYLIMRPIGMIEPMDVMGGSSTSHRFNNRIFFVASLGLKLINHSKRMVDLHSLQVFFKKIGHFVLFRWCFHVFWSSKSPVPSSEVLGASPRSLGGAAEPTPGRCDGISHVEMTASQVD